MVIFYRPGTSPEAELEFHQAVLSLPTGKPNETTLPPGVVAVFSCGAPSVKNSASCVEFSSGTTRAMRESLRQRALASPVVQKVLENVALADIKPEDVEN
jgi:hypothetical protein